MKLTVWIKSFNGNIMKDSAKKKSGRPDSLSRKWKAAAKKNTCKKRRQEKF